jgi:MoxR-like ATPase
MKKNMTFGSVNVTLQEPLLDEQTQPSFAASKKSQWLGDALSMRVLLAAWFKSNQNDAPMNPKIVGRPGVGKTTLAIQAAREMNLSVFLLQCTADTKPEDLLISPLITENQQVKYVASPLVSAMVQGGVCVLDEGNRMAEKSWASLAPLLDHRRYVDSILIGHRIEAHPEFRFVTTMNDDSSVFQIPEYIESRLNPKIALDSSDEKILESILNSMYPEFQSSLNKHLVEFVICYRAQDEFISPRECLQVLSLAKKMMGSSNHSSPEEMLQECWGLITQLSVPQTRHSVSFKSPLRPV